MKKYIFLFFKIIVSVSLVYFVFTKVNIGEVTDLFAEMRWGYFLLGLFFMAIVFCVSIKKWQLLLRHLNINESFKALLKLGFAGVFYGAFLPGGQLAGETIKGYRIIQGRSEKEKIVFSIVMDKLMSLVAFVVLGFGAFIFYHPAIANYYQIFYLFVPFFLGSIVILSFFNIKTFELLKRFQKFVLSRAGEKINSIIHKIMDTIFLYRGAYQTLCKVLFYGLTFQLLSTLGLYFFALSIYLHVNYINLLWVNTLVNIVLIIPVTIMGLGIREGSFVYILSLLGVPNSKALGLSLLFFLSSLIFSAIGGILELL